MKRGHGTEPRKLLYACINFTFTTVEVSIPESKKPIPMETNRAANVVDFFSIVDIWIYRACSKLMLQIIKKILKPILYVAVFYLLLYTQDIKKFINCYY